MKMFTANMIQMIKLLMLLSWIQCVFSVTQVYPIYEDMAHFYQYGKGDNFLRPHDGDYVVVPIGNFTFCEDIYQRIFINQNGILTFGSGSSVHTPKLFPWDPTNPTIAPYWADVNQNVSGFISYRTDVRIHILDQATRDVRYAFPSYDTFVAEWTLVVTWHEVGFSGFNQSSSKSPPTVTFQAVLISGAGSRNSFVRFAYGVFMEWTTGVPDGGDPLTGLGGIAANIGYDSTDATHFFNHPDGMTSTIHDAVQGQALHYKLHCNGNGGTNDPHFIIASSSADDFFCFDYGGQDNEELDLVSDLHSDIAVKGSLFAISEARPDVTYFKEITIKTNDATITLDRTDIIINDKYFTWNMSKSVTYRDITLRPLKQRDETIEVSLDDRSVSLVINRHHDLIGYFLGVYLSKTKGLSSHTKGILGKFVHHDFEVNKNKLEVTLKLAEGDITLPVVSRDRYNPYQHGAVKCWLYAPKDEENILFKL